MNHIKGKIDRLEAVIHLLSEQVKNCDPNIIFMAMEVQRINDNIHGIDVVNDQAISTRLSNLNKEFDKLAENYINGCGHIRK